MMKDGDKRPGKKPKQGLYCIRDLSGPKRSGFPSIVNSTKSLLPSPHTPTHPYKNNTTRFGITEEPACWGTRIRTSISGSKTRRPAVRRYPKSCGARIRTSISRARTWRPAVRRLRKFGHKKSPMNAGFTGASNGRSYYPIRYNKSQAPAKVACAVAVVERVW